MNSPGKQERQLKPPGLRPLPPTADFPRGRRWYPGFHSRSRIPAWHRSLRPGTSAPLRGPSAGPAARPCGPRPTEPAGRPGSVSDRSLGHRALPGAADESWQPPEDWWRRKQRSKPAHPGQNPAEAKPSEETTARVQIHQRGLRAQWTPFCRKAEHQTPTVKMKFPASEHWSSLDGWSPLCVLELTPASCLAVKSTGSVNGAGHAGKKITKKKPDKCYHGCDNSAWEFGTARLTWHCTTVLSSWGDFHLWKKRSRLFIFAVSIKELTFELRASDCKINFKTKLAFKLLTQGGRLTVFCFCAVTIKKVQVYLLTKQHNGSDQFKKLWKISSLFLCVFTSPRLPVQLNQTSLHTNTFQQQLHIHGPSQISSHLPLIGSQGSVTGRRNSQSAVVHFHSSFPLTL